MFLVFNRNIVYLCQYWRGIARRIQDEAPLTWRAIMTKRWKKKFLPAGGQGHSYNVHHCKSDHHCTISKTVRDTKLGTLQGEPHKHFRKKIWVTTRYYYKTENRDFFSSLSSERSVLDMLNFVICNGSPLALLGSHLEKFWEHYCQNNQSMKFKISAVTILTGLPSFISIAP